MKKLYTTSNHKLYNKRIAKKLFLRSLVSKSKKKTRNKYKHRRIELEEYKRAKDEIKKLEYIDKQYKFEEVEAPKKFSFIANPEEVSKFIQELENFYSNEKNVSLSLKNITDLDYSAVTILLSIMVLFKSKNLKFRGNFPKDKKLANLLVDSDFFKYLNQPITPQIQYEIGKENQIFTAGNKCVNSELGLFVMKEASKTIWGEQRTCKGLQRTLLELMQNTNNHAALNTKGQQYWWLSVNHDKISKKVSFIFIDYGVGIFESLRTRPETNNKWFGWFSKIAYKFKYGGNDEVFKMLLEGELHLTVTGQHFRGKGLPGIKQVFDRNQISNLQIISNDIHANIEKNQYSKLNSEFSGTFVYWELNENNINLEWTIQ